VEARTATACNDDKTDSVALRRRHVLAPDDTTPDYRIHLQQQQQQQLGTVDK